MTHFNLMSSVGVLAATAFLVACGGGVPANVEQSSGTIPNSVSETVLPITLTSPKYALTRGDTIQMIVNGGKMPYLFKADGGTVTDDGIYSASVVGTYRVTVTDDLGTSQSITLTVAAPVTVQPPVTAPSTSPPVVVVAPATQAIYRNFNTIHGLHQISMTGAVSGAGWTSDGELYRTYVTPIAGMSPLYVCQMANLPVAAYFESRDPNCEGQIGNLGAVGYVYNSQQPGTSPLVRFSRVYDSPDYGRLVDHIDLKTFSGPGGYAADGVLGYVPN